MKDDQAAAEQIAAILETLTPAERVLFHGAAICMIAKEVLVALQKGEQHPAGVYAASGNVLTVDGKPTAYELVAVMVPLEMLQPFAIAHAQARNSPDGAALAARLQTGFPVGPSGSC